MNRRNDCLNNQSPGLLGVTNRRLDQDVTSSYIHIKSYKCSKTTRNTVCAPPPLLFKLLIYNTLTRKGFDPSTQIITQNFTTNWFIKILIQTLKDDNMFGFFFRGWVGTSGPFQKNSYDFSLDFNLRISYEKSYVPFTNVFVACPILRFHLRETLP